MNTVKYIRRVIFIIFLTNVIAISILPLFFEDALGWILGSIASAISFWWLAVNLRKNLDLFPSKTKIKTVKNSFLRYMFLIVYTLIIMGFVKPNIITFGLGLMSSQMAIYLYEIYLKMKK